MAGGTVKCFLCKATVSRVMKVVSSTGYYVELLNFQFHINSFPMLLTSFLYLEGSRYVSPITKSNLVETTVMI